MHYLLNVIDTLNGSATTDEIAARDAFHARLRSEGRLVAADSLADLAAAELVDARGAGVQVDDGPLIQSPEFVSGVWIVTAEDAQEARDLAAEASRACNRRIELRACVA